MRTRITYAQHPETPYEHHQTTLTKAALSVHNLDAARQETLAFDISELPQKISKVLDTCHEIRFRWATERGFETVSPFLSRVSPGLSAFFVPGGDGGRFAENPCPLIREAFGREVNCSIPETTFTTLPTTNNNHPVYQYYTRLPTLDTFVTFIRESVCDEGDRDCHDRASLLCDADSFDVDYHASTRSLTLSGYWSTPPEGGWTEEVRKRPVGGGGGSGRVDVGILTAEKATEYEELKMGGLLAAVGEDEKMSPTMFSFPSRHHPLPDSANARYTVSFNHPTSLHPVMTITIPESALTQPPIPIPIPADADNDSNKETCTLHTHLTLPSPIFADKYQLSTPDTLFQTSHNIRSLTAHTGETDLEAPDWSVTSWGSTWLLRLATPPSDLSSDNRVTNPGSRSDKEWNVTIPLHLRYMLPAESGYRGVSVPWPVVFWACTAEPETERESEDEPGWAGNPFDRSRLGWEGLFGESTVFYQLRPAGAGMDVDGETRLVEELNVPVLSVDRDDGRVLGAWGVEVGTVVVILVGLVWVLWKLGLVVRDYGVGVGDGRGVSGEVTTCREKKRE